MVGGEISGQRGSGQYAQQQWSPGGFSKYTQWSLLLSIPATAPASAPTPGMLQGRQRGGSGMERREGTKEV